MQVVEAAVEARKVHILQQDTWGENAKTYSFPVDAHLTQLTVHVTNHKRSQSIEVRIRNQEGKLIGHEDGLKRLMKAVHSVFVGSIDRPAPGEWTLEVSTKMDDAASSTETPEDGDESEDQQAFSVRISGISDVDLLQGFATTSHPFNYGTSRQPIGGVKNYIMVNMTGRFQPGRIDYFDMRSPNGTSLARIPAKQTPNTQIYVSQHPVDPLHDHAYLQVSGRDSRGFALQRYSKVALSGRKPRPIVITCPAKVELQRGATSELSCFVSSEIPYTIKWYKDGKHLGGRPDENQVYNFASDVKFVISDANEDSHGIYAAEVVPTVASSELKIEGEYKDEVAVVILPPPPRVLVPRNSSVEPGADAVLTCNVFSLDEDVEIRWFRGLEPRFELKEGRRYRVETQQASPSGGPTKALISKLTVTQIPMLSVYPIFISVLPQVTTTSEEIMFKEGGSLVLGCLTEGVPQPKISWLFNKVPIAISGMDQSRITIHEEFYESRLIIQPAGEKDAGQYSCVAINSAGNNSAVIVASYISIPKIEKLEMSNMSPVVGKGQTFTCHVSGQPKPRIKWEFNGSPAKDEGIYTCIARNVVGKAKFDIELDVQSKPAFLDPETGTLIEVTQGDNLALECQVEGDPKPTVEWRKDGRRILPHGPTTSERGIGNGNGASGPAVVVSPDGYTLTIYSVNDAVAGSFTCSAINVHSIETKEFRVSVKTPPVISKDGPSEFELGQMEVGLLTCLVTASQPQATVRWFKNGQPLLPIPGRISFLDNGHTVVSLHGITFRRTEAFFAEFQS
ncbi:Hemicentin 1 [Fasciola gigantica]|uniref:Hemicentin 1 n=1 Tax=Fasciola gigantica TaxID=46835 RepID=A0A504YQU3_FASGI|nr:Hemicentin 1 [Fasciola gigantica]